jgi:hypothetical protein
MIPWNGKQGASAMAVYKEVRTDDEVVEPVTTERAEYSMNVAARIIYFLGGILLALLAIRFLLALFGANPANGFADFIYTVSHPFVVPFFGLFNYTERLGVGRFEYETLVAIVIYAIVMEVLARLVTLGSRRRV